MRTVRTSVLAKRDTERRTLVIGERKSNYVTQNFVRHVFRLEAFRRDLFCRAVGQDQ
jgi:hypothetical protein